MKRRPKQRTQRVVWEDITNGELEFLGEVFDLTTEYCRECGRQDGI